MTGHATAAAASIPETIVLDRGTWAMSLFIATEAALFVCLFFSYYYLGQGQPVWPPEPPQFRLALVMLVVLLTSSGILHWGERRAERGALGAARGATAATAVLGVAFLGLQVLEYRNHLLKLRPTTNAYGSIFYTLTSIHAAHVVLGICMLLFVLALPDITGASKPPHRPLHNASLYWHFVDLVWVLIVALIYVAPNVKP